MPLSDGAEIRGIVAPEKRQAGVLIRQVDGKYVNGNAGEISTSPQRAVKKAIAAAEAAGTLRVFGAFSELQQFPVSELFSRQPPVTHTVRLSFT